MRKRSSLRLITFPFVVALAACDSPSTPESRAVSSVALSASATPPTPSAGAARILHPIPSGPVLAILPGKGVGSIRFGATVDTVERHMAMPCETKDASVCHYFSRAIDFIFDGAGLVSEIHIHGIDRPSASGKERYGAFNGRFPEGAMLGMLPRGTAELLGPPARVEPISLQPPRNTAEVHHYPNMRLEFDTMPSGELALAGVILSRPTESAPAASK